MTNPKSGDKEFSSPVQPHSLSVAPQSRSNVSEIPKGADAVRSASSPQLMATKLPRSKVYRKTSLKCEIDVGNGDGGSDDAYQRKSVVRYVSAVAEKKQKRRSLTGKETDAIARSENTKWNPEHVHITCNPLSTPYPYSTPSATTTTTTTATTVTTASKTTTVERDEEPKSRTCGSFLPILALIPQSVISFQYLSPKMKFSWWRNKIS
ncbi:uncharacterized protein LOC113562325 [Ooceraea biroi]|uniref:Uncharacterized protein n=1 Tax=Ooceraea biroi TaxID=2015173 RepID=A0A026WFB3_OOCBI|nr:uncharacterized protein LOC113562325 [Ooceraea biroi]EZA54603.1 hypothetical protein X777_04887 [Ooceraea biroi]